MIIAFVWQQTEVQNPAYRATSQSFISVDGVIMLKLLKVLFGFIVVVLIALFAIPFFVNVNDYKPEIKQAVYDATGRNIEISNIKLSLFPWVGITLTDVQFENAQGFQHPNMLEVASIDVKVALMPLFDQQVEVKNFELNAPKIWLTQHADGSNNWSDLSQTEGDKPSSSTPSKPTEKPKSTQKSSNQSALPIAFEAKLLQLRDGQVIWQDTSKGEVVVRDIQLNITDLQLKQPIGIDVFAKIGGNPINIKAEIGPVLDISKLDATALPALINIKSKSFSLKPFAAWLPTLEPEQEAMIGKLSDVALDLDISIEQHSDKVLLNSGSLQIHAKHQVSASWKTNTKAMRTLKIESFKLDVNNTDVLSVSGKVRHLDKQPRFEGKVTTGKLQRIWLNTFAPALQETYKEHPKPWESIKLEAFLAADAEIVEIRNMQLTLNDEPIQMSGDIVLGGAPDIQLRITAGELHLDPWIPQSKETASTTQVKNATPAQDTEPAIEPDLTLLKPWYLSIQLQAKTIHAMQLKLENLRMTLSSEKGVVRLNPLSFEINGGRISENMTLYANRYPATWKESMRMKSVSIQPILKSLADFDKLSGITTLNTNMSGVGLLPSSIIKSVSGRGDFLFENGQFEGVDIAKEIRKLKKQPSESKQSDFAKMVGTFYIKDAVLTNNDLYMTSPLFRLSGKGKVMLDPPSIDYRVRPKLVNTLEGQGGSINKKGVVVPLHIFGSFDDIQVETEFDKDAILDSAAAINDAAGKPIGGVGGQVLDQGFVKTRDEQVAKAKAEAKRKADAKVAAEKARLEAAAKKKAEEKLKDMFKGFSF